MLFHQVDFGDGEAEVWVATDGCVTCPVLVLRRAVVEVLGREDERSEEYTMDCASHALSNRRKS